MSTDDSSSEAGFTSSGRQDDGTESSGIRHILLLDDETAVARALTLLLGALGFEVTECTVAADALRALDSSAPIDLFLCDLRMPDHDGLSMLQQSKAKRPSLPVVLMSGHASSMEVEIARKLGCFKFLMKPFSVDQLKKTIAELQE